MNLALPRFIALSLLALTLFSSVPARSQTRASCAVRQVLGRKEPGGLDPAINFLKPQLSKAPFTAWTSFKYLNRTDLQMSRDEPKSMILVTGHKVQIVYLGQEEKQLRL